MPRTRLLAFAVLALLLGGVAWFAARLLRYDCADEPARPPAVPATALWRGDCNGGYWYDTLATRRRAADLRLRIYDEATGARVAEADFAAPGTCAADLPPGDLRPLITGYGGGQIYLESLDCALAQLPEPAGPAGAAPLLTPEEDSLLRALNK